MANGAPAKKSQASKNVPQARKPGRKRKRKTLSIGIDASLAEAFLEAFPSLDDQRRPIEDLIATLLTEKYGRYIHQNLCMLADKELAKKLDADDDVLEGFDDLFARAITEGRTGG